MALQLEYRRTFIDVVEHPKCLSRYHSLPAFSTPMELCEDDVKAYVAGLSDPDLPLTGNLTISEIKHHGEPHSMSFGSLGHEWGLCKRPCALYAAGYCKHGADCAFCHMSHGCRLPKLDKLQREKLKALSVSQLLSVVLEPLKMKVAEQGIENEAAELISLLGQELQARDEKERAGAASIEVASYGSCSNISIKFL